MLQILLSDFLFVQFFGNEPEVAGVETERGEAEAEGAGERGRNWRLGVYDTTLPSSSFAGTSRHRLAG